MNRAQDYEIPTEEDIYDFTDHIPPSLEECAAGRHPWISFRWDAYDRSGKIVKDPTKGLVFEVDEVCKPCGQHRYQVLTFPVEYGKNPRSCHRSAYTYSDRNALIKSPPGVSQTGISVRATMGVRRTMRRLAPTRVQLPATGTTKDALEGKKPRKARAKQAA